MKFFGCSLHLGYLVLLLVEFCFIGSVIYTELATKNIVADRSAQAVVYDVCVALLVAAIFCVCFAGLGLYSSRQNHDWVSLSLKFGASLILLDLISMLLEGFSPFSSPIYIPSFVLVLFLGIGIIVVRYIFHGILEKLIVGRGVLVIGAGKKAKAIQSASNKKDNRGFFVVCTFDSFEDAALEKSVKNPSQNQILLQMAMEQNISEIVIADLEDDTKLPVSELMDCKIEGVRITDANSFLERETGRLHLEFMRPGWLIFSENFYGGSINGFIKRQVDILGSALLFFIMLPVSVLTVLAMKLESGIDAPIFYRQLRVGKAGQTIEIIKFRSMVVNAERAGQAIWAKENDCRVTQVGSFIRKYRIDEIPQLFNVLVGDMSLVGPRPERPQLVNQIAKLSPYYKERHRVKPGLTGWAQLCYEYGASEEDALEKLRYDLYYIKYKSIFLDLYILVQTIEVVLFGKGAR